jgi:lipoprotein NlpI
MLSFVIPLVLPMVLHATPRDRLDDPKTLREQGKKAIADKPNEPRGFVLRGRSYSMERRAEKAVADFTRALELKPDSAEVLSLRGGELFKLGRFKESVTDFDKQIQIEPGSAESHWRRGISLYYAERYEDGAKQFQLGAKIYFNDVENAFWHYLCLARKDNAAKAREKLLRVGADSRYYMPKVYDLIADKAKPKDVLAAVEQHATKDKTEGLFYANLYIGLNYEAEGNAEKSLEYVKIAVEKQSLPARNRRETQ